MQQMVEQALKVLFVASNARRMRSAAGWAMSWRVYPRRCGAWGWMRAWPCRCMIPSRRPNSAEAEPPCLVNAGGGEINGAGSGVGGRAKFSCGSLNTTGFSRAGASTTITELNSATTRSGSDCWAWRRPRCAATANGCRMWCMCMTGPRRCCRCRWMRGAGPGRRWAGPAAS